MPVLMWAGSNRVYRSNLNARLTECEKGLIEAIQFVFHPELVYKRLFYCLQLGFIRYYIRKEKNKNPE
ncbi:hypothetical protein D1B33_14260 [Lysinibacillus yapensis]|uniref:Uncharacterized protein n=1 Tax=Ureibacillus yapensis TaxID=2304605 RepID=A0A396SJE9_9BACL|nr:hypothetical protein [Lysinibacillus yapensis]RHW33967.1 hypothetical protein D1B33_14260 [Lysinibacillus yapensis]